MLKDAIDHKIELQQQRIAKHNFELLEFFTQNMDKSRHRLVGPTSNINRSSITCIYGDENLERYLINNDIVVKLREGMIRIGVHFYNTKSDIKHLLNCLEAYDSR